MAATTMDTELARRKSDTPTVRMILVEMEYG